MNKPTAARTAGSDKCAIGVLSPDFRPSPRRSMFSVLIEDGRMIELTCFDLLEVITVRSEKEVMSALSLLVSTPMASSFCSCRFLTRIFNSERE